MSPAQALTVLRAELSEVRDRSAVEALTAEQARTLGAALLDAADELDGITAAA